jgi:hypothetical protein
MSDRVAYDTWVQANQRCLVGEFDRLKARLTGGESAETAGHNIDEIDAEGPAQAAIDVLTNLFGLSRFERDVLLLCAGVEMNSELARVCGEALAPGHRSFRHLRLGPGRTRSAALERVDAGGTVAPVAARGTR